MEPGEGTRADRDILETSQAHQKIRNPRGKGLQERRSCNPSGVDNMGRLLWRSRDGVAGGENAGEESSGRRAVEMASPSKGLSVSREGAELVRGCTVRGRIARALKAAF